MTTVHDITHTHDTQIHAHCFQLALHDVAAQECVSFVRAFVRNVNSAVTKLAGFPPATSDNSLLIQHVFLELEGQEVPRQGTDRNDSESRSCFLHAYLVIFYCF